eukprot:2932155-Rhodomonas_salina.3
MPSSRSSSAPAPPSTAKHASPPNAHRVRPCATTHAWSWTHACATTSARGHTGVGTRVCCCKGSSRVP